VTEKQIVQALSALAQETRLTIAHLLSLAGDEGLSVGAISEKLGGVNPATLSHHLKELTGAGLILSRRQSRHIFYSINPDGVASLMTYLKDNCFSGSVSAATRVADSFTPSFLGR